MSHGTLYMTEGSQPSRAVLMTEKILGLDTKKIDIDVIHRKDQLKPDYIKMNPQHTIPFYIDPDGIKIADSHVIMIYMVSKFAKDDQLYPKDLAKQAKVNHRLFFDNCDVLALTRTIVWPILEKKATGPNSQQIELANGVYKVLNTFLTENEWMAGDHLTLADICLIANITSLQFLCPIDPENAKLLNWIEKCKQMPFYDANIRGLEIFQKVVGPLM